VHCCVCVCVWGWGWGGGIPLPLIITSVLREQDALCFQECANRALCSKLPNADGWHGTSHTSTCARPNCISCLRYACTFRLQESTKRALLVKAAQR
jgi:hypothetical protein